MPAATHTVEISDNRNHRTAVYFVTCYDGMENAACAAVVQHLKDGGKYDPEYNSVQVKEGTGHAYTARRTH